MVFVTGDIHSDPSRLSYQENPEFRSLTKEDTVIILGDFGLVWNDEESSYEKYWLDWLEDKSFTTVFVDGNHENHPTLLSYPVKEWNGGLVNEIRPSVLHLMRGEVYNIEGKTFFAFGGASSHDIRDGILTPGIDDEKIYLYRKLGKMFRINGVTWWKEELPNGKQMQNGINNLDKVNWNVDYVLTHCGYDSLVALLGYPEQDILTKYLGDIHCKLNYKRWYLGHYHTNMAVTDRDIVLYERIERIL